MPQRVDGRSKYAAENDNAKDRKNSPQVSEFKKHKNTKGKRLLGKKWNNTNASDLRDSS